jgi:hypothetical protein
VLSLSLDLKLCGRRGRIARHSVGLVILTRLRTVIHLFQITCIAPGLVEDALHCRLAVIKVSSGKLPGLAVPFLE